MFDKTIKNITVGRKVLSEMFTSMLKARLHPSEEAQPPLPSLQLPFLLGSFPFTGTLAMDLGLKL